MQNCFRVAYRFFLSMKARNPSILIEKNLPERDYRLIQANSCYTVILEVTLLELIILFVTTAS